MCTKKFNHFCKRIVIKYLCRNLEKTKTISLFKTSKKQFLLKKNCFFSIIIIEKHRIVILNNIFRGEN